METDNPLNHAKPTWTGRGGEEFLWLMRCISADEAEKSASRLLTTIRATPVSIASLATPIALTVTLDLACAGENEALSSAIKRVAGCWRALPQGEQAAIIGRIKAGRAEVVLETELGGERILPELEDDPLPRIC